MNSKETTLSGELADQPLSVAGSPVKTLAQPGNAWALKGTNRVLSLNFYDCWGISSQIMHYLKMYPDSGEMDLKKSSEKLPTSGMMRNGTLYELRDLEHPMNEKGRSLWPTPSGTSNHHKNHVVGRLDEWGGAGNRFRGTELASVRCASFEEWMMGLPMGWTEPTQSEIVSSRSKSTRSSKRLQTLKEESAKK